MHLSKRLIWMNVSALVVNALFVLLAIVKVCPAVLSLALFVGCLAGCILFSARVQGLSLQRRQRPAKKQRPSSFHSDPTERVTAL